MWVRQRAVGIWFRDDELCRDRGTASGTQSIRNWKGVNFLSTGEVLELSCPTEPVLVM